MRVLFWLLAILGSLIGGFFIFIALTATESAPQEASAAAIGLAFAVVPYCLARAYSELRKGRE